MDRKRIGLVVFDGVSASHVGTAADVFAAASLNDGYGGRIPCYQVTVIGPTSLPIRSDSGTVFQAQESFDTACSFDTIIISGGRGVSHGPVNAAITGWLRRHASETRRIAAICTGIFGLAPTGLLNGREVTTHWRYAGELTRHFPQLRLIPKRQIVKDGCFYTSAGVAAALELPLLLIEEDFGFHVAVALRQELMLLRTPVDRDPPAEIPRDGTGRLDRLADLVSWILRNLDRDLSVEALARRACMCPRHFSRAFKDVFGTAPGDFVKSVRLNEARRRLSSRPKAARAVGASVGFCNSASFGRAFEQRFGARPARYLGTAPATSTTTFKNQSLALERRKSA